MKLPSDFPERFGEMLEGFAESVEEQMFAATEPLIQAREVARLSMVKEIIREVELLHDVEFDQEKERIAKAFDAKRAS